MRMVQQTRRRFRTLGAGAVASSAIAIAVVASVLSAPQPAAARPPVPIAQSADRYTPLVMSVFAPPRWFKGADGRFHLVYELTLTNGFPVPITVRSISVLDPKRGVTLQRLSGAQLTASMSLLSLPSDPTTAVPASGVGVIWFEVVVRGDAACRRGSCTASR